MGPDGQGPAELRISPATSSRSPGAGRMPGKAQVTPCGLSSGPSAAPWGAEDPGFHGEVGRRDIGEGWGEQLAQWLLVEHRPSSCLTADVSPG